MRCGPGRGQRRSGCPALAGGALQGVGQLGIPASVRPQPGGPRGTATRSRATQGLGGSVWQIPVGAGSSPGHRLGAAWAPGAGPAVPSGRRWSGSCPCGAAVGNRLRGAPGVSGLLGLLEVPADAGLTTPPRAPGPGRRASSRAGAAEAGRALRGARPAGHRAGREGGSAAASGRRAAAGPPRGPTWSRGTEQAPGVRAFRAPRAPLPLPVPRGPRKAPVWTPDLLLGASSLLPAPAPPRDPSGTIPARGTFARVRRPRPCLPRGEDPTRSWPGAADPAPGPRLPGVPPAARESRGEGPGRVAVWTVDGAPTAAPQGASRRQRRARLQPGLGTLVPGSTPATVSVRCRGCKGPVSSGLEECSFRGHGESHLCLLTVLAVAESRPFKRGSWATPP